MWNYLRKIQKLTKDSILESHVILLETNFKGNNFYSRLTKNGFWCHKIDSSRTFSSRPLKSYRLFPTKAFFGPCLRTYCGVNILQRRANGPEKGSCAATGLTWLSSTLHTF